jgi:ELWxxDGT repeat protein
MTTGKVLFVGLDASGFGSDLWVTDGTSAGTSELTVAGAPTGGGGLFNGNPDFTVLGGTALFEGLDASSNFNLWVTDGTSGGTSELKVAGAFRELSPTDLTVFGNKVLFEGAGTDGDNLWVTNGTAAGTSELHPSMTNLGQLGAQDLTVFGNKVLFAGASLGAGLWITDGTSAGTELLSASEEILFVSDLTVLGGKALFAGADRENPANLWVTDGTSAGTSELTIARTNPVTGTRPANITVIGGRALFTALDSTNGHETTALWVTNGTSAGTSELAIRGGGTSGLFFDVAPAFAVLGSKALFAGDDVAGHIGLWVTDGTSAGTKELAVAGASTGGLVPRDITVFGDKALFVGDGPGFSGDGLWVTDGTAAGTSELTVAGTYSPGFLGIPGFTVFGGKVLFEGYDSAGHSNLWVTDGTSAGTKEIVTSGAFSAGLFNTSPADFTVLTPPSPPAPSGLALAAGSDSGVKGDDITNVTKPVIVGKGVAGDKVTLFDGAKAIGTATVAAAGTWSVTSASALAAGLHSLTATESGATGTSAASAALKLTIKVSAPAPSGLSFAVAADKGAKGDTMTVGGRGEAGDRVTLYDGKTAIGGVTVTAAGVWSLTTASPLAVGAHSLNANEVDVAANRSAASPAQSLTVVRAAANAVVFVGTAGVDNFTGGPGNDIFEFSAANLANSDTVKGGVGTNELLMTTAGTVRAGGIGGVETFQLANGAANSLTLVDANFAGVTGGTITVYGGNAGNTVNASALTGADRVWCGAGPARMC